MFVCSNREIAYKLWQKIVELRPEWNEKKDFDDKDFKPIEKIKMVMTENKAKDLIQKKDKQRASYYNYYSCKKWGDSRSYDLTLNTSKITPEQCVDIILAYREKMQDNKKNK